MRRTVFVGWMLALPALVLVASFSVRGTSAAIDRAAGPPAVPAPGDEWPQFRGGPWHGGVNPFEHVLGPGNVSGLSVKWRFHIEPNLLSSPVVRDGVVYIGADADRSLYALHENDGTLKWKAPIEGFIGSTPAVSNGLVFVASDTRLHALRTADGSRAWSAAVAGSGFSSPVVVAGVVFVGSGDGSVSAYRAGDGRLLWQAALGGRVDASPAVAEGSVLVGTTDGRFYALDAETGARLWTYATGARITGSAAVRADGVYAGSGDGTIFALERTTGALRWRRSVGGSVASSPAVADNAVYIAVIVDTPAGRREKIKALRRSDGRLLWAHTGGRLRGAGPIEPSPSLANGVVYAGSLDGSVTAFAADSGAVLWQYRDNSAFFASPAIVDGQLFIAAAGTGTVYDFALPTPTSSQAP